MPSLQGVFSGQGVNVSANRDAGLLNYHRSLWLIFLGSQHRLPREHPFILLTAKADEELRLRLLREGAIDYLVKPFIQEELRSKARNFLAVKASEAKYRGLMESAQVGVGTGRGVAG